MSNIPKPRGNIINSYEGSVATSYSIQNRWWLSLAIYNDGSGDLTFTVNGLTITVAAGEVFDDDFEDFNQISINSDQAYRLVLRG